MFLTSLTVAEDVLLSLAHQGQSRPQAHSPTPPECVLNFRVSHLCHLHYHHFIQVTLASTQVAPKASIHPHAPDRGLLKAVLYLAV